jgi:hypothetical protein
MRSSEIQNGIEKRGAISMSEMRRNNQGLEKGRGLFQKKKEIKK